MVTVVFNAQGAVAAHFKIQGISLSAINRYFYRLID